MRTFLLNSLLAIVILLQGCASTGQLKRNEKVTLILQDGHKIKCYVTHVGRKEIFFQALTARDAYNYGDVLLLGQVARIRLPNKSELTVGEYRDYRQKVRSAEVESEKLGDQISLHDPLYESLKYKSIEDMSEKEFKYFLLMKEQENLLRLREQDQADHRQPLEQLQKLTVPTPVLPPPNRFSPPAADGAVNQQSREVTPSATPQPRPAPDTVAPDVNLRELVELLNQTGTVGRFLSRLEQRQRQGFVLSPGQTQFIQLLKDAPAWQDKKENLRFYAQKAHQAIERAYTLNPHDFQEKLQITLDLNRPDFEINFVTQLYQQYGAEIGNEKYQQLLDLLGETGARAVKELLSQIEDWQVMNATSDK
ncbi:hypothetical protein L0128_12585 [candidate division KSB1 bacterium]|nr:hypothetical protein [candidate division KSB1 bacterium]